MDGINWGGLVQRRNFFDELADGLSKGEGIRLERQRADMLQQRQDFEMGEARRKAAKEAALETRQKNVGAAVAKGDYAGARTAAEGDFDMLKSIGELDGAQRKAARDKAEDLGGFAAALKNVPYDQRRAIIAQAGETLTGYGFTPEQLAAFDPTDQALDAQVAGAMDLKTALEEANRQRDDKRAGEAAEEQRRHNRASEATAARNASTSAFSAQTGRLAYEERKRQKGFGTPGVSGVRDEDVEIDP